MTRKKSTKKTNTEIYEGSIEIVCEDSARMPMLKELKSGETFRFPGDINSKNVYMVIAMEDVETAQLILPGWVSYVLLGTGKVYSGSGDVGVCRTKCKLLVTA